jgi:hypothetical protein
MTAHKKHERFWALGRLIKFRLTVRFVTLLAAWQGALLSSGAAATGNLNQLTGTLEVEQACSPAEGKTERWYD